MVHSYIAIGSPKPKFMFFFLFFLKNWQKFRLAPTWRVRAAQIWVAPRLTDQQIFNFMAVLRKFDKMLGWRTSAQMGSAIVLVNVKDIWTQESPPVWKRKSRTARAVWEGWCRGRGGGAGGTLSWPGGDGRAGQGRGGTLSWSWSGGVGLAGMGQEYPVLVLAMGYEVGAGEILFCSWLGSPPPPTPPRGRTNKMKTLLSFVLRTREVKIWTPFINNCNISK